MENEDWDKVLLVPVSVTYDTSNQSNPTMTGIQNDLKPAYTKLQGGNPEKGGSYLELEVTYTSFNK